MHHALHIHQLFELQVISSLHLFVPALDCKEINKERSMLPTLVVLYILRHSKYKPKATTKYTTY